MTVNLYLDDFKFLAQMIRVLGWDKQVLKTLINYGCKEVSLGNVWPMWQMNVLKWWFVNVNHNVVNEYKLEWNDLWDIEILLYIIHEGLTFNRIQKGNDWLEREVDKELQSPSSLIIYGE